MKSEALERFKETVGRLVAEWKTFRWTMDGLVVDMVLSKVVETYDALMQTKDEKCDQCIGESIIHKGEHFYCGHCGRPFDKREEKELPHPPVCTCFACTSFRREGRKENPSHIEPLYDELWDTIIGAISALQKISPVLLKLIAAHNMEEKP